MNSIIKLAPLVKAKTIEWRATPDDEIVTLMCKDRFEVLEMWLAEVIGLWYIDTKEKIKDRGEHYLGRVKEHLKLEVEATASNLREGKISFKDAVSHIELNSKLTYEYAVSQGRKPLLHP